MFLLCPHHTGWPQQSMKKIRQTSISRLTLRCCEFDVNYRVHCTDSTARQLSRCHGRRALPYDVVWHLAPRECFKMLYGFNVVLSNFEVREEPFHVLRRPSMGDVHSRIGAQCCRRPVHI
jgi:hypothetical protein